uniref:Transthyretin-like family protein n=1 Tax=Panagrellus redivivus TaxID=6233 RepID=A0A7E4VIE6_PANRE
MTQRDRQPRYVGLRYKPLDLMKSCALLIAFFAVFAPTVVFAMRQQAVAVKGILLCGDKPAEGVQVKLWDEDDGPDPDDELDAMFTNADGSFDMKGSTRELTTIDPIFKVYHDCNDGVLPGQRKIKLRIPTQYIAAGGVAKKVFDVGILNLETVFPGEERDLL